jgi:heat shock protein HslJ
MSVAGLLLAWTSLAGCVGTGEASPPGASAGSPAPAREDARTAGPRPQDLLAGAEWRLVEFQSMDDAIGTVRPHHASQYTMRLDADGTVAMRLHCNQASGTWSAEPSGDGSSGSFRFGPLATTLVACPPPSLDERIVPQLSFVRSYLLRDGRLYLSLMADGGIYAWER